MPLLGAIHEDAPASVPEIARMGLLAALPVPAVVDWSIQCPPDGDPLGNDRLSNCVAVAELRAIQMRRRAAFGDEWKPDQALADALYGRDAGYVPGDPSTDRGTTTTTAMSNWATHGVRINLQDLDVVLWLSIDRINIPGVQRALAHTGPVQLSLGLPRGIEDDPRAPWRLPPLSEMRNFRWQRSSWGGHRVLLVGYDRAASEFKVRSWGVDILMSADFMLRYGLGIDATLSREWFNAAGVSPAGLTWDPVFAEFASLRGA